MKQTYGQCLRPIALACAVLLAAANPARAASPAGAVGDGGTLHARCPESQLGAEKSNTANAGAAKSDMPCSKTAPGQNEPLKNLPALKRPALQQTQSGLSSQAEDLNPQPLPPKKPALGDPAKAIIGNSIKQQPALTQFGANANTSTDAKAAAAQLSKNLFSMEDRVIIIVGGKQTTAGEVKKKIHAEIAKKAGPPKTVKGGARKLDLAALNVKSGAANAPPAPPRTMNHEITLHNLGTGAKKSPALTPSAAALSSQTAGLAARVRKDSISSSGSSLIHSFSESQCLDKGPPVISEVEGRLKPGGKVTLWGRCLGDRAGRVEIIGQFPGGKLKPAFTAWDMTVIDLEIPANIRGATDHAVAVTVVTADGKTSPAMQAQFAAAREWVEVPERLWSPGASFELSSAEGTEISQNKAYSGQLKKSLRINHQCALDTMDAIVLSGNVTEINGWVQGPPNEASVTMSWFGSCSGQIFQHKETDWDLSVTFYNSYASACRVAFQARAWAYCPVGIAP